MKRERERERVGRQTGELSARTGLRAGRLVVAYYPAED